MDAVTNAAFYTTAAPKLRVTEIMYTPSPPPVGSAFLKDDYEFLELQNTGATSINPSGIVISNGIDFTFPAGSAARSRLAGASCRCAMPLPLRSVMARASRSLAHIRANFPIRPIR